MNDARQMNWAFGVTATVVAVLVAIELFHVLGDPPDAVKSLTCPNLEGGCTLDAAGIQGEARFVGAPSALVPFDLFVRVPGARVVRASFAMVGMDMGLNRYQLVAEERGWKARVVLPACVAGRRDWVLELDVDGALVRIPFVARK